MLISEAFKAYASDVIAFRNQSAKTEEHHFVALTSLLGFIGDVPVTELTFENVRDWKISMEKRNLSVITIRGYLIKLRVVLAYLAGRGFEVLSPEQIPLPKRIDQIPEVISAAQVQLLIDTTTKPRNKAIISLLYSTGLRVSELCALNRSVASQEYFTVIGKGGKSRLCFIDKRSQRLLKAYLRSRMDNEPALFISPLMVARITPGGVQEIFKHVRKKAGFDFPVHPHTMRHSFATNLNKNGASLRAIQLMMGHASVATTQIYLHIYDSELVEDYQKYHSI